MPFIKGAHQLLLHAYTSTTAEHAAAPVLTAIGYINWEEGRGSRYTILSLALHTSTASRHCPSTCPEAPLPELSQIDRMFFLTFQNRLGILTKGLNMLSVSRSYDLLGPNPDQTAQLCAQWRNGEVPCKLLQLDLNENINGMLRQYFPKDMDRRAYT